MKTIKPYLVIVLLSLLCAFANAQSAKEKRADKYYESFAYVEAARLYEKLIKNNVTSEQSVRRLADCYFKIKDSKNAEIWYKKMYDENKLTNEELYNYAQCLKANEKYTGADAVLQKFYSLNNKDTRAISFSNNRDIVATLKNQDPYFEIKNVDGNSAFDDFGAVFYNDKVFFSSNRSPNPTVKNTYVWNERPFLDLYMSSKDDKLNLVDPVKVKGKINSKFHEGPVCFTNDGQTMYFTRNNYYKKKSKKSTEGVNNLQLYRAKMVDGNWKEEKLAINSNEYSVGHATLSNNEKVIYFISDMPGGQGGTDIYKAELKEDGTIGTPENLGNGINTEGNEMFPYMDEDGNLYFSSNGHAGLGQMDIFMAPFNRKGGFRKLINLGIPINSGADDFAFVLSRSEDNGYVSSNRDGGKGNDDIYSILPLRPIQPACILKGVAYDNATKKPLANTKVQLKDKAGVNLGEVVTKENGDYTFDIEPKKEYELEGSKADYLTQKNPFNTNTLKDGEEIKKDLYLDYAIALVGTVKDLKTGAPLKDVEVTVHDKNSGLIILNDTTDENGQVRKSIPTAKVGDAYSYKVDMVKKDYLPKTSVLENKFVGGDNKFIELLGKPEVGLDLGKMIDIKPIYFDLNKSNIRPDAALELDKIVAAMKEYPGMVIELGSHTDCRATKQYNMSLSDRRAKSSAAYIVSKGIEQSRIYGKGYGESKLINGCACEGAVKSTCSEEEHQLNRRTEFIIVKMK
ncbi:MAG: OmpA family protein [Bacteroidetes bacterium]|nr:OmpA family protein [Bacteroidota bacterium]